MASVVLIPLLRRLKALNVTRARMENLYRRSTLALRDIDIVYEGLYLNAVTTFETFLEQLFVRILLQKMSYAPSRAVVPRVTFKSTPVLRNVLIGERRRYIDWLPYDRTLERADIFLRSGRPFSEVGQDDRQIMNQIVWIRNAIAHRSHHAMRLFENNVLDGVSLPSRHRTPPRFLRSQWSLTYTRFEKYLSDIARISRFLDSG